MSGIDGIMAPLLGIIIYLQVCTEGSNLQPHGCDELFNVKVCTFDQISNYFLSGMLEF